MRATLTVSLPGQSKKLIERAARESGLTTSEYVCHEIVETRLPDHVAILTRIMWDELVEKLREKFGLHEDELPLLDLYRRHATWVEPPALATLTSRDPTTTGSWPRPSQVRRRRS